MKNGFDFYEVLGVRPDAQVEVIAAAYRALAKKYHPDSNTNSNNSNVSQFLKIQSAYETLSSEEKRKLYDSELARYMTETKQTDTNHRQRDSNFVKKNQTSNKFTDNRYPPKETKFSTKTHSEWTAWANTIVGILMLLLGGMLFAKGDQKGISYNGYFVLFGWIFVLLGGGLIRWRYEQFLNPLFVSKLLAKYISAYILSYVLRLAAISLLLIFLALIFMLASWFNTNIVHLF